MNVHIVNTDTKENWQSQEKNRKNSQKVEIWQKRRLSQVKNGGSTMVNHSFTFLCSVFEIPCLTEKVLIHRMRE